MNNFQSILAVIILGLLSVSITFVKGMPVGADFQNHFGFIIPFFDELNKGNFFPGWLAESNQGFGDPRFRFYPPFLYYLLCLANYLIQDWFYSTLVVFSVFSVIGTLGIYFWLSQTFTNKTAVIGSLIFAFVPYHLTQFFQASLLAEFAATAFLPWAFCFVQKISTIENSFANKPKLLFGIGGLTAFYSFIVTTHLPTTVIASLSLGVYALLLTDWKNNKKSLAFCALGILLGLLASSWFLFRMLSELSWIQAGENVSSAYYEYRNNFLFSPFALVNLNTWYGNLLLALTIAYLLPSFVFWRKIFTRQPLDAEFESVIKTKTPDNKKVIFAGIFVTAFSLLMTTELSRPIWAIVPKLRDIQFPYRWLTIASVSLCPLLAVGLLISYKRLREQKFRALLMAAFIFFLIGVFYTFVDLVINADYVNRTQFIEKIEGTRGARSFNDWLPRNAKELKDLKPISKNVEAGNRQVEIKLWDSMRRVFVIEAGQEKQVRVKTYYYPHWHAFRLENSSRQLLEIKSETDGTILIVIPSEKVEVELLFTEPELFTQSLWLSLAAWLLIFSLLIQRIFVR